LINGDTEKSSELKRFRMTHSPRNKSGKLFGVAIDFLWKKEKNKTRTQIYLYTKKQLFERRACCLLHSNTRWPQRVRQYSSHPPKIKKMGKMRSPAHTQDATRTRRSSRICRVFHSLSLKNKRGRFVFFFFYFFLVSLVKATRRVFVREANETKQFGGLKKERPLLSLAALLWKYKIDETSGMTS
jgi:hypothetical protein